MAWSAPYSLVPETDEGVQSTNPFTSSQQQANYETQQANANIDVQVPRGQEVNADSKNSYVPPDATFASTGSALRGNVGSTHTKHSDHSHTEGTSSQENTAAYKGEQSANSIYQPSGLTSDHPVKERPQSLLTNLKDDTGQKPKKGILKTNDSSSIRFSTPCAVPMSRSPKLTTGSPDSCSTGREIEINSSGIVILYIPCKTDSYDTIYLEEFILIITTCAYNQKILW